MVIETPTLWESATVVPRVRLSHEEAFAQFCRRNPRFMAEQAHELWLRGNKRLSMKGIFEVLRMDGEFQKIDNSWTALATRRLVEDYPDLAHLFVTRKRKKDA